MSQKRDNTSDAIFHPAALAVMRTFPESARRRIGKLIWDLQQGIVLKMPVSRSMPPVMPGCAELRVKDASGAYRIFYVMKHERGVLIFHAFWKKSEKTPKFEIEAGRKRLKELLDEIE